MSTKLSSSAHNLPAQPTTASVSAAAQQLLDQAKGISGAAPTAPAPQAAEALLDTIERRAKTPPEYFERISDAHRPAVKELPGILPTPVLIADLLHRADSAPSHGSSISALLNRGHDEVQLTAATIGVHQRALAHLNAPPPLPDEVNAIKDNLAAQLPASASATQLVKALPNALNAAGLDRLKNDASCALALKDALDNPAMLRATLAGALDKCPAFSALNNDDKALVLDAASNQIKAKFTSSVCGLIKEEVVGHIKGARALFESVNQSPATRRAALIDIASKGPDERTIHDKLGRLGLDKSQRDALAPLLHKLHADLKAGGGQALVASPAFKTAEATLHKALNARCGQLDLLERKASNDHLKNDRILRSDLCSAARAAVFSRLGVSIPSPKELETRRSLGVSPGVTGAAGALAEAMLRGKSSDDTEERLVFAVNLAGGVLSGGVAAGLIGTLVTSGVGAIPDLAIAQSDLEAARGAHNIMITGGETITTMEDAREVAVAKAALGLLLDGTLDGAEVVAKGGIKPYLKATVDATAGDVGKATIQEGAKASADAAHGWLTE
jgi:hypothetical protein